MAYSPVSPLEHYSHDHFPLRARTSSRESPEADSLHQNEQIDDHDSIDYSENYRRQRDAAEAPIMAGMNNLREGEKPYPKDFRFILVICGMAIAWFTVRLYKSSLHCPQWADM
jgi:hypothetical protein